MSAETDLFAACREWRRIAVAEGDSINGRNWTLVAACQATLAGLQPRITRLLQSARTEWARMDAGGAEKERMLRTIFADLIRLEKRNAETLHRLRAAAGEKIRQLQRDRHNLQRLQRSYASPPGTDWCSLS
jgi:hypothetical protein